MRRARRLIGTRLAEAVMPLALAAAGCAAGCGTPTTGSGVVQAPSELDWSAAAPDPACEGVTFEGTYESADAVALAFLSALAADDVALLETLALNEREFRCLVWPQLPASRPGTNLTVEYVWNDLNFKGRQYLAWTRQRYGRQQLTLHDLRFAGATTDFGTFVVRRGTMVRVSDGVGGTVELQLFGSMLESGGRYKLFSFVTD